MDATPTFGGLAGRATGDARNLTVKLYAGPTATGAPVATMTAAVAAGGDYSIATTPLVAGTYTAQAEQADLAGNVGRSAPVTFTVDPSLPPQLLAAGDIALCGGGGDEATAALLDRRPGIVAPVGDLAYPDGSSTAFAGCYGPSWGRHRARTRPTPGDHEYDTGSASAYFDTFGAAAGDPAKGYYSYDLGTWHAVVLNGECSRVGGCEAGSPEEQWLRQDLAASTASCTVAFMHHPLFSSGGEHGSQSVYRDFWRALYDGNAEIVLSGDDHDYERFAPQTPDGTADPLRGIRQFVVGTGGGEHISFATPLPNSEVREANTFGILRLVLGSGGYDWEFMPVQGQTFTDSGSGACH
jgi:hypothetical protein